MSILRCLIVGAIAFTSVSSHAEEHLWIEAAGSYGFSSSALDSIAGATYSKQLAHPLAPELAIGIVTANVIYLGAYTEYWIGSAKYDSGTAIEDNLKLPLAGLELGYRSANPRVFKHISIGAAYPLSPTIDRAGGGSFKPDSISLTYRARVAIGFRLFSRIWMVLRGGYRLQRLGRLSNGGTPLLASGSGIDLSGAFLGAGFAVSL